MQVAIVGAGYVGEATARWLQRQGMGVWLTTRDTQRAVELEASGIRAVRACFEDGVPSVDILGGVDAAVITFAPSSDSPEQVSLQHAVEWVTRLGARRVIYLSSTGVWGPSEGRWVHASSTHWGEDERSSRRLEAEAIVEREMTRRGGMACSLRVVGIYGPGRSMRDALLAGRYRLPGDGAMWSNRVFIDDLCDAVRVVLQTEAPPPVLTVSDDRPFRVVELIRFLTESLGIPLPASQPIEERSAMAQALLSGNRRVCSRALRALGWRPAFPTFRQGYPEAWAREDEMNTKAESGTRTGNSTRGAETWMLLGSGELGREVALEAMRLGIRIVACDRYDDAPAMRFAEERRVFNMQDPEALRRAVEEVAPDAIVPEVEAIHTATLMDLEAEGWRVVPTARAAHLTMNREGIRRLAAEELGLPTSPYRFASSLEEVRAAAEALGYPLLVKPVMSSSGKGQSLVREPAFLDQAWAVACEGARGASQSVIVEGFVAFDEEITLLTVRERSGKVHFCPPIGHRQEGGDYQESWQPQALSPKALARAEEVSRAIVDALGGCGTFGVELFIQGDEVVFSEVSPRPHDTGMVTLASQNMSEFELHVRAIAGLPIGEIRLVGPGASAVILASETLEAPGYSGVAEALQTPDTWVRIFSKPTAHPKRRMGVALVRAADTTMARAAAVEAARKVKVVPGAPS